MEIARRGKGFIRCRKDENLLYIAYLEKTQKTVAPLKVGWAYCMRKIVLTLAPDPLKPLPIVAAHHGLLVCGCGQSGMFNRPSHPVQVVERTRHAPASCVGYTTILHVYPPPAMRRSAPICAPFSSLRPSHSPPPWFTQLLQLLRATGLLVAVVGLPSAFVFYYRLAKAAQKKPLPKRHPP